MNLSKAFSRRSFIVILLMTALLLAVVDGILWYCLDVTKQEVFALSQIQNQPPEIADFLSRISSYQLILNTYFLPVTAAFFFAFALILWFFLRASCVGLFKAAQKQPAAEKKKRALDAIKSPEAGKKESEDQKIRLFLYMVSLLQRDGRLVDFFAEDLDLYADDQIGAAVRNIHQNCKKIVFKNLAPGPVIDGNEGEEITVDSDFDPNAIKLTGNVTGDPPFQGVLRHKGWRVKKLELPRLSSSGDSKIIAPAEVEIP